MRALEIWSSHPELIIACLDAKSAAETYRAAASSSARDMSPEQVDWMLELDGYAEEHMRANTDPEARKAEAARRAELESFKDLPY